MGADAIGADHAGGAESGGAGSTREIEAGYAVTRKNYLYKTVNVRFSIEKYDKTIDRKLFG